MHQVIAYTTALQVFGKSVVPVCLEITVTASKLGYTKKIVYNSGIIIVNI